jgi:hypothetical protein
MNSTSHLHPVCVLVCGVVTFAQSKSIKVLCLSKNDTLGAAFIQAVVEPLSANTTLTALDLSRTGFGAAGAKALASVVKRNACLQELKLVENEMKDEGGTELAQALKVRPTPSYVVSLRCIQEFVGGVFLQENTSLTQLNLAQNGISDCNSLASMLVVNQTLTSLNLQSNPIGEEGALSLSEALKVNRTLRALTLHGEIPVTAFRDAYSNRRSTVAASAPGRSQFVGDEPSYGHHLPDPAEQKVHGLDLSRRGFLDADAVVLAALLEVSHNFASFCDSVCVAHTTSGFVLCTP